ncbi:hypothetical protein [Vampirovibrio chlorellavorus]|uniref:hypothetical protein n=1 Tax=Vampirovibrio chlorellavorus TaxID=758823 RepID=UPI0026EBF37F|nr:hypothetical protein [Vampirovibrio chlorellavorus]
MVLAVSFKNSGMGPSIAETDSLSPKRQARSGFLGGRKHQGVVPSGGKRLVITNGLLNPNPQAVRNPIPRQSIQALQATFHPYLKLTEDPNEALRSLVLLGTRLLRQAEGLRREGNVSNARLIAHSNYPAWEKQSSGWADLDLLPAIQNRAKDKNCLQRSTATVGALLFFSLLYQQPEILAEGLSYFAREGIREGVKDAQGQWVNQSENLKFDLRSLFAKVQNKALPADTLIFSKADRELMATVAAGQGFDIQTDAGLQAYTRWIVQLLQKTAEVIETVGQPYQLSMMGYGRDAHGLLKKTGYQDVFQRRE